MTWIDVLFGRFKIYRKLRGGIWYKHRFNADAYGLNLSSYADFWARYDKINRYSDVVETENYLKE